MHRFFLGASRQARDTDLWFWTCTVDMCWRILVVLPHYGVNCCLITMPPVPMLYCVLFGCWNCRPTYVIPSTPPETPFYRTAQCIKFFSTAVSSFPAPLLLVSGPFLPRALWVPSCSESCSDGKWKSKVMESPWELSEIKGGNSEHLLVGPDLETARGSRKSPGKCYT